MSEPKRERRCEVCADGVLALLRRTPTRDGSIECAGCGRRWLLGPKTVEPAPAADELPCDHANEWCSRKDCNHAAGWCRGDDEHPCNEQPAPAADEQGAEPLETLNVVDGPDPMASQLRGRRALSRTYQPAEPPRVATKQVNAAANWIEEVIDKLRAEVERLKANLGDAERRFAIEFVDNLEAERRLAEAEALLRGIGTDMEWIVNTAWSDLDGHYVLDVRDKTVEINRRVRDYLNRKDGGG